MLFLHDSFVFMRSFHTRFIYRHVHFHAWFVYSMWFFYVIHSFICCLHNSFILFSLINEFDMIPLFLLGFIYLFTYMVHLCSHLILLNDSFLFMWFFTIHFFSTASFLTHDPCSHVLKKNNIPSVLFQHYFYMIPYLLYACDFFFVCFYKRFIRIHTWRVTRSMYMITWFFYTFYLLLIMPCFKLWFFCTQFIYFILLYYTCDFLNDSFTFACDPRGIHLSLHVIRLHTTHLFYFDMLFIYV